MLIGLGGGAASSQASAEGSAKLDYASVQRGNAEVQRRAQEVINACVSMGSDNPILFIHGEWTSDDMSLPRLHRRYRLSNTWSDILADIGAGGLSNGIPEIVHDSDLGATIELRDIENADHGLSPLEIW